MYCRTHKKEECYYYFSVIPICALDVADNDIAGLSDAIDGIIVITIINVNWVISELDPI